MSEYTQGVCQDGAAILKDGQMMTIEEILNQLRASQQQAETIERLKALLAELSNDAEAEYEAKYYGMLNHPSMKRGYDRDMDIVNRAKTELNKLEAGEL